MVGKEIDHIEHTVAFEQNFSFMYTEYARGFTIFYTDGTSRDFKYHDPDPALTEAVRKQGRLKQVVTRYETVEEMFAVLISELRKDGKDATTLASKAYAEKRKQERAGKKAGAKKALPA
jgi:hypothetical protein